MFIGRFNVLHHNEDCKIVAEDQDGVFKRYSTSQIRLFLKKPSMLDNTIAEPKIHDRHVKTDNDQDELEYDDNNVQL